ncbi:MAG: adenylate/guanylate cyclase domain-containing protein [Pseudomonadota bacterium]
MSPMRVDQALRHLIALTRDVSQGRYDRVEEVFRLTDTSTQEPLVAELAEAFGMMIVQVEGREFRLQGLVADLERKNAELQATLHKVEMLEHIRANLGKFVPRSVAEIIDQDPEAPDLDKRPRDVSVLFLDIAGYTSLSEQVEAQEVNRLVERYFSSFLDDIYQNHGDINETAGDGLMIIFQHQEPREHARAAVRCALAIGRRVREINQAQEGRPVLVNQGINSGQALVGSSRFAGLAGDRWTFTASGPVTNLAARLGGLAREGQVLLGPETASRLGEGFALKALGPRELKNVAQPVEVWEASPA